MKKIAIIVFGFLIIIIAGILIADFVHNKEDDNKVKVGMILNGEKNDQSWSQSHYEGMEKTKAEVEMEIIYCESVPENEECLKVMEDLVSDGCNIIICNSYDYGQYELQIANKYPDVIFYHAAGAETADNLSTYFGRIYQMRYLSGIVAGMQTETNEIGYVAAFPIPEVNRGINAFTLGVRSVNPDAVVYVEWCNSWTGQEEGKAATEELLANHNIDVITMHTDAITPLELAEERGIWSIGYNIDNSKHYPNSFLTAAVWNWDKFYTPRIKEYGQGKFVAKSYWENAATGMVGLAPFTDNVNSGISVIVDQEKEKLESGKFDVFYGPIKDSEGNLRVQKGESMSDTELLYEFDWYVEGVVMNEQ